MIVVIMAGGMGKRMNSALPKVLHTINDEPMLVKIIRQVHTLNPLKILVIVGHYYPIIKTTLEQHNIHSIINNNNNSHCIKVEFVFQPEALGTGHAIQCCIPNLKDNPIYTKVLIVSGDVPLLRAQTMKQMMHKLDHVKIMVTELDDPTGYGRILTDNITNQFQEIVEEKDCTEDQRKIRKINCGIYAFSCDSLCTYLPFITNNNKQKEYYLTDLIAIIHQKTGTNIEMLEIPKSNQIEIMGVNTPEQLNELAYIESKM